MINAYSGCLLLIIAGGIAFLLYKRYLTNRLLYEFIDLYSVSTVLTNRTKILMVNRAGLNLFGEESLHTLLQKTPYLNRLFTEISEDGTHYVTTEDWVTKIDRDQKIKVEVKLYNFTQILQMQVSKVNENRYLVTFHDITRVEAEKNAITKDAQRDELTQIYNRKKFNTTLTKYIHKSTVHDKTFSVILFDIDHFKRINDTYGHDVGDKVLVHLSALIKNLLRGDDLLARWGGEEFVILSPESNLTDGYELANRLRREVEQFTFPVIGSLTCSFGVAEFEIGDTQGSLLKRADEALYLSKANGRNQVSALEA